jgi:glycosyltransferase involved in cell wall biosynthesis
MKISLVVPVFNEEEAIPIFYKTVREFEGLQQHEVEIVFINDGSKDATESIINALAVADPLVVPLSFTRNFGKEPALFAGLDHATGEAIIPIDVDLQDPIEVIPHLIEKWQAGRIWFWLSVLTALLMDDSSARPLSGSISCTTKSATRRSRKTLATSA